MRRLLILLLIFLVHSVVVAQQIDIDLRDATLEKVFREIERKSKYRFIYTKEEIDQGKPVSISIKSASIEQLLTRVLADQSLGYTIHKNYITIYRQARPEASIKNAEDRFNAEGKIVDVEGKGLAGASIMVEGSGRLVISDGEGYFEVKEVKATDQLIVTMVGFQSRRLRVSRGNIIIEMERVIELLDEAIVKGYYKSTKRENTGAVVKVRGEELRKQPVSNPLAGLAGRTPGLFIRQSNGLPGSNFTLLIRGQNSLRSGTEPLYIIDGVPFDVKNMNQRAPALNTNHPLNTLSPFDIESIEILKDADAIAIYGSRGSNGVILITTKKAKKGDPSVDVNFYYGLGKITRGVDYMDTRQYMEMRREAFKNDGVAMTVANAPDLLVWDTTRYTDWQKMLIQGTANYINGMVKYNGGSEQTRFGISGNFFRETTVFPGDFSNERLSTMMHIHHKDQSGRFNSLINSSYTDGKNNLLTNDLSNVINLPPNAPKIYDSTGALIWSEGGVNWQNPFAELLKEYYGRSRRWSSSMELSYKLVSNFELKINGGVNSYLFEETQLIPIASQNPSNNPKGSVGFGNSDHLGWNLEPQLGWNKEMQKHKWDVIAGMSFVRNRTKKILVNGSGYSDDGLLNSLVGATEVNATNDLVEYRYMAGFGRIGYSFNKKLMLNLTGRRDGSSRFGQGKQFANFGAVGAGWIFTEENWMKSIPVFSFGKLRGSYGTSGNDQIGDYQFMDTWTGTSNNYGGELSLRPTRLHNTDYSWEQNQKMDIGMEVGLLKNRYLITVDWYRNLSKNQLITQSIPSQTGFVSIVENFPGEILNKGWEIEIDAEIMNTGNFNWRSSFNITAGTNSLKRFDDLENTSFANSYRVGKPVNSRIGYVFEGLDKERGIYVFRDMNSDSIYNSKDYTYLGTTDPQYYGGWQNSIKYKNVVVEFLFQFTKQKVRHPIFGIPGLIGGRSNYPAYLLDRWQKPGDDAAYQKYTQQNGTDAARANLLMWQSSASLTDAAYIRLKNLSVRLDLGAFNKRWQAKSEVFIQGQNLLTITKFRDGDPENATGLSPLKVLTAGINVKL